MAPAVGIEPTASPLSVNELLEGWSPDSSPDLRLLLRVVEAWPNLNGSLKVAILAIIEGSVGR